MKTPFDENTLSAFMDGELDMQTMHEVDTFVGNDPDAQRCLLGMVRKTALLKSAANAILSEPIPERLLAAISAPEVPPGGPPKWPTLLRVAAVFVLMILGYGAGAYFNGESAGSGPLTASALPQQYEAVVGKALEHNLSGTPLAWQDRRTPEYTVTVTPVRTYQDRNGRYFREYRLEMAGKGDQVIFRGLAHRTGKARWKTTALFF